MLSRVISNLRSFTLWHLLFTSGSVVVAAFGATRMYQALLDDKMIQRVNASSAVPAFELRRTERLTSAHHDNRTTLVITIARNSEGDEVSVTDNLIDMAHPRRERVLVLVGKGLRIEVDDSTKLKSTFRYGVQERAFVGMRLSKQDPATLCRNHWSGDPVAENSGEEQILDISTVKQVVNMAGNIHTRWLSPLLGCVPVREWHEWAPSKDGKPVSVAKSDPDYIRLGVPDPRLFEIASEYTEVLPSVRKKQALAAAGASEPSADVVDRRAKQWEYLDSVYTSRRP